MLVNAVVAVAGVLCCVLLSQWAAGVGAKTIDWKLSDPDNEFHFGEETAKYVIYRLIGNDMPPLQMVVRLLLMKI